MPVTQPPPHSTAWVNGCATCGHPQHVHFEAVGTCEGAEDCTCSYFVNPAPPPDEHYFRVSPEVAVRAEREKVYGDALESHINIGRAWGAILDRIDWQSGEAVPPHAVAAMMAALKILRGLTVGGEYHSDSYLDAKVYIDFVDEFHPARPDGNK